MKGNSLIFIILLFFILPDALYSQTRITVTKPRLEVSDDNLIIQYDIINTNSSDFFVVWIEVTDAAGNKVKALTVTGDVGENIKGGKNKKIIWNLGNDSIIIDEDIFVEVKAEKIVIHADQTEVETLEETETVEKNQVVEDTKTVKVDESLGMKEISKGNMLLSSMVLPGWGQSKAEKGKPYWIIGAAGYACLAGSVIMNINAKSVYENYKSEMDLDDSDDLFEKASKRKNVSKYLAYSAIGIWAADIIWVLATPAKSSGPTGLHKNREFRIVPCYDVGSNMALVSLTLTF